MSHTHTTTTTSEHLRWTSVDHSGFITFRLPPSDWTDRLSPAGESRMSRMLSPAGCALLRQQVIVRNNSNNSNNKGNSVFPCIKE